MIKKTKKVLFFILAIFFTTLLGNGYVFAADQVVYLGGIPAGFSVSTRGAYVLGTSEVVTEDGIISPSFNAGIRAGDIILYLDSNEINNAIDIENSISDGKSKLCLFVRDNINMFCEITPVVDLNGNFKLGLYLRDGINGIGTITYIFNGEFGSLGHPVLDESGEITEIKSGNIFTCDITGLKKGERGKPGELKGVFSKNKAIGVITENTDCGVFGIITDSFNINDLTKISIGEARPGNAFVYTTINGCKPKMYSVLIVKVDGEIDTKNFIVKITDKNLIGESNGIVQGMSGSPIVQNNKLVGAITHVFINDPTRGYGVSIYKMLNR